MSAEPPREPRHHKRLVEGSLAFSGNVQTAIGQAQALIATAIGRANDASVRIEEFGASAATPRDVEIASRLAADNDAMLVELRAINEKLAGIRVEASQGGRSTSRENAAFALVGWFFAAVAIIVAVLVARGVIHP